MKSRLPRVEPPDGTGGRRARDDLMTVFTVKNQAGITFWLRVGDERMTRSVRPATCNGLQEYPLGTNVTIVAAPEETGLNDGLPQPVWCIVEFPDGSRSNWPMRDLLSIQEEERHP